MAKLYVLNGPNLNLLGTREPDVYGSITLESLENSIREEARKWGVTDVTFLQSNHEGALIDALHEAGQQKAKVIFNPGAYTHTSVALHDAIKAASADVIEVHLSNIASREPFRHHSYVSPVARGVIAGLGGLGYTLAVQAFFAKA
jgi:3-dehydroquinate dehydratase-2